MSGGGKSGGAGTQTTYSCDADFLLGYGPCEGVAAVWQNSTWIYAGYSTQDFSLSGGSSTTWSATISNSPGGAAILLVMGVALQVAYSESYSDYVLPGLANAFSQSGSSLLPLYNDEVILPNCGQISNGAAVYPYATYNTSPGSGAITVTLPAAVTSVTFRVYYAYLDSTAASTAPITSIGLVFDKALRTELSGIAGSDINLGPSPQLPQQSFEVKGLFGMGNAGVGAGWNGSGYSPGASSGDCCPADLILDLITSGNHIAFPAGIWAHGAGFSNFIPTNASYLDNFYHPWGGILADESNLWGSDGANPGTKLGLNAMRTCCMAYDIWVSGIVDSQQSLAEWLQDLCDIALTAPVWDGAGLAFIPYPEQSAYGNGTSYVAPTAAGPLFTLGVSDFLAEGNDPPVIVQRARSSDDYNSLPIEFLDAQSQYNVNSVSASDAQDIMRYGPLPGSSKTYHWLNNSATALRVAWGLLRRTVLLRGNTISFKLPASYSLLTPMDLIEINEPSLGPVFPVRLTKISENEDYTLSCEAEPFIYGVSVQA